MSPEEVMILIHENALQEMQDREQRMLRALRRMQSDLDDLGNEIRDKRFSVNAARERWLRRTV